MRDLAKATNRDLASELQASRSDLAGFSTYIPEKIDEALAHKAQIIAFLVDDDKQLEQPTIKAPEGCWSRALLRLDQQFLEGSALTHVNGGINHHGGFQG